MRSPRPPFKCCKKELFSYYIYAKYGVAGHPSNWPAIAGCVNDGPPEVKILAHCV